MRFEVILFSIFFTISIICDVVKTYVLYVNNSPNLYDVDAIASALNF